jgi:hypothetical protein
MKKARFLFVMIFWAVLAQGASFGSQSGQAREQTGSQSDEKSANNSSPDGSKDPKAHGQKDQTGEYSLSDENQKSFAAVEAGTPKVRKAVNQAKPAPRQLRSAKTPTANNLPKETPRNTLDSRQTSSTMPSQAPNKPLKHTAMPVPPPTVALNGQQFKNSRDPGARMATSGGSANSARGTAAINGSDIKRKP